MTKQLNKLVNVIKSSRWTQASCVGNCCSSRSRPIRATGSHVLETAQLFRANVVDVNPDVVVIEATGQPEKLKR